MIRNKKQNFREKTRNSFRINDFLEEKLKIVFACWKAIGRKKNEVEIIVCERIMNVSI